MKFRFAGISDSFTDGIDYNPSVCVFFQGCTINCPGCQNPDQQPLNEGIEIDTASIIDFVNMYADGKFYKGVVFTGGDPMEQPDAVIEIAKSIKLPAVLYTGRLYSQVPFDITKLFKIIVDGPYIESLKTSGFPASSNQQIHRVGSSCQ